MSKILCVDDDVYLSDLLRYALSRDGHAVQIVHRGADALQILKVDLPDAVLLDVTLPDMDGFTLCTRLRNTYRLPVILLTARHADEDMIMGFKEGADDYVTKPFNMQVLLYRLRAVLRRSRPDSAGTDTLTLTYRLGDALFSTKHNEILGK